MRWFESLSSDSCGGPWSFHYNCSGKFDDGFIGNSAFATFPVEAETVFTLLVTCRIFWKHFSMPSLEQLSLAFPIIL